MTRSRAAQLKSELDNDNSSITAAFIAGRDITGHPETIEEALTSKNSNKWRLEIRQEYESLLRKKTWALAQKKDIPAGQQLFSVKLVFKTKRDKEGKVLVVNIVNMTWRCLLTTDTRSMTDTLTRMINHHAGLV